MTDTTCPTDMTDTTCTTDMTDTTDTTVCFILLTVNKVTSKLNNEVCKSKHIIVSRYNYSEQKLF